MPHNSCSKYCYISHIYTPFHILMNYLINGKDALTKEITSYFSNIDFFQYNIFLSKKIVI